jgi:hypothetical protein
MDGHHYNWDKDTRLLPQPQTSVGAVNKYRVGKRLETKEPDIQEPYTRKPKSLILEYLETKEPYIRNRQDKEAWERLQKENQIMQRKLRDVKREPPSTFHAANGYKSLQAGKQMVKRGKEQAPMPGTNHYVDGRAWPPTMPDKSDEEHVRPDFKEKERVMTIGNEMIHKKLVDVYKTQKHALGLAALSNKQDKVWTRPAHTLCSL